MFLLYRPKAKCSVNVFSSVFRTVVGETDQFTR